MDGLLRLPESLEPSDYILATYYLETPLSPREAAEHLAAEQSTGTWLRVKYETEERRERFGAKVVGIYHLPYQPEAYHLQARMDWIKKEGRLNALVLRIAFPWSNFGPLIPNLLSAVAGNLFEMDPFTAVKLLDIEFPPSFTRHFRGPKFGVEGCRRLLGVYGRPFIGAIMKPCVGLSPEEIARLAYEAAKGGLDFIKDDELLADTSYNSVRERARTVTQALKWAEQETGHKTMYAFNITDRPSRVRELHDIVVEAGGICVMVNVATLGIEVLRELSEYTEVPIHVHRDFAPAYIRSPYLGMTARAFTKICRLAGADQLHVGAIKGKLFETDEEVVLSAHCCLEKFHEIAPSLPVSSGGQWAGKLAINFKEMGTPDFLHLSGAGVFAHPMGAEAGARSLVQAWEALSQGVSLEEYAKDHRELQAALRYFGSSA